MYNLEPPPTWGRCLVALLPTPSRPSGWAFESITSITMQEQIAIANQSRSTGFHLNSGLPNRNSGRVPGYVPGLYIVFVGLGTFYRVLLG